VPSAIAAESRVETFKDVGQQLIATIKLVELVEPSADLWPTIIGFDSNIVCALDRGSSPTAKVDGN